MQLVIKLFPEILLKSASIHRRMTMILQVNIQQILQGFDADSRVQREWDKLIVTSVDASDDNKARHLAALANIPGIQYILDVALTSFTDAADIVQQTHAMWHDKLAGKSFCVRVRRSGQHPFSSLDLQRQIGSHLFESCINGGVNLRQPDQLIQLEVVQQQLFLVRACHDGIGGYPLGTQESVLSLISGGFDSALASYQFIRRGSRVHYCFFNLGGAAHMQGVQKMAYLLWSKFGSSHGVRFIAVDFERVLTDIIEHVPVGNQGVILKRMMLRVADKLAQRLDIPALVTGEALGQVASQTLTNLQVIDRASDTVVMRPLITWDKPDIVAQADKIGVRALAESIPEYCGAISNNPTIKANLRQVEKDERHLNPDLLAAALNDAAWFDACDLAPANNTADLPTMEKGTSCRLQAPLPKPGLPQQGDIVLDIRAAAEVENKPLHLVDNQVMHLPFYQIPSRFETLDQSKTYFLYCERGVMSRLQASHLQERGFQNVAVYHNKQSKA